MATSRDVARMARVSQATVWAVLSGKKYVSEDLRKRVLAAVAELDYQTDELARGLKTRQSGTVGVVIPTLTSPTWNLVLVGVEETLAGNGLTMILSHANEDYQLERHVLGVLRRRRVDGLLVAPAGPQSRLALESLVRAGIPVVMNTRYLPELAVDAVIADERGGSRAVVSHLLGLGRRRIGMIGVPEWSPSGAARLAGYRDALSLHGVPLRKELEMQGRSSEEEGFALAAQLLSLTHPPDAIFASTHVMTMGVLRYLKQRGIRVPDDIALASFNDLPWSQHIDPPLTTVQLPQREIGATAAQLLVQRLKGDGPSEPRLVVLPTTLVVRRSCGAPEAGERTKRVEPGPVSQPDTTSSIRNLGG
ncbi:MAG: LacI family DNA-binding transcriptional regulator [Sphingomonadaceae bacterium]